MYNELVCVNNRKKYLLKVVEEVKKMKYKFTESDQKEIEHARKINRDKQIENRLKVLAMRCQGLKQEEIAKLTGFARSHVCSIIRQYFEQGITAVSEKHYKANHRNLSLEEEVEFLKQYKEEAEKGHIISVKEMESAYIKKVGHKVSKGQIYNLLHRHNWRKIMPRSKHPKKANEEAIEASKKLKQKLWKPFQNILKLTKT